MQNSLDFEPVNKNVFGGEKLAMLQPSPSPYNRRKYKPHNSPFIQSFCLGNTSNYAQICPDIQKTDMGFLKFVDRPTFPPHHIYLCSPLHVSLLQPKPLKEENLPLSDP